MEIVYRKIIKLLYYNGLYNFFNRAYINLDYLICILYISIIYFNFSTEIYSS
jgi:hypothetical protein